MSQLIPTNPSQWLLIRHHVLPDAYMDYQIHVGYSRSQIEMNMPVLGLLPSAAFEATLLADTDKLE